jgi:curved DNA-binding protein CbpA
MKLIEDYKILLGVEQETDLKTLKTAYRTVMKQWHPDKFVDNHDEQIVAEAKSKQLIEAYHFLVSIADETIADNLPEYNNTTLNEAIVDYQYKKQILQITFSDGSCYEYFNVPKQTFVKLHNADTQNRFARRHICHQFLYRNIQKANVLASEPV